MVAQRTAHRLKSSTDHDLAIAQQPLEPRPAAAHDRADGRIVQEVVKERLAAK